jgi:PIN domain nuclease of toxin-antitoxin system
MVEILEQTRAGRLRLNMRPTDWIDSLLRLPGFAPADLTRATVMVAESLYVIPERGDRLIAATALELDVPLISRYAELAKVPGLKTVWS